MTNLENFEKIYVFNVFASSCFMGASFSAFSCRWGQDWMLDRLATLSPRNLSDGYMQLGCIQVNYFIANLKKYQNCFYSTHHFMLAPTNQYSYFYFFLNSLMIMPTVFFQI